MPFKTAKRQLIDAFECAYLQALVRRYGKNLTRASKGADLSRRQLRELMRKHGYLPRPDPLAAAEAERPSPPREERCLGRAAARSA